VALVDELAAAVGCLTFLRCAAAGRPRQALAAGLAFYPAVGLLLGAVAAGAASAVGVGFPALAGAAGIVALEALAGGRPRRALGAVGSALLRPGGAAAALGRLRARPGPSGIAVALAALAAKLWAAAAVPPAARTVAFLLAPMLGRWAIVVQCYGGAPTHARGPAAVLVGRARFREFGWASLVAFGVTLALGEAVGLVVLLMAALVTVGLRVYVYRRIGGLTGRLLAASGELVETGTLAVLALLAQLNT